MKVNCPREQKDEKKKRLIKMKKTGKIFFFKLDIKGKWVNE